MKKIFYLATCDTCKKIMKELDLSDFEKHEIKSKPISKAEFEEMKALAGSYEALFSRRAKLYKEMGLKEEKLEEKDFLHYLLEHYTFLKRPVIVAEGEIFVGSNPKTKLLLKERWGNASV